MAPFDARSMASGKWFILRIFLVLLVCYSSKNWVGPIFMSTIKPEPDKDSHHRNETSSISSGDKTATYIQLPLPNASAPPISFSGCCGIGHRLKRNLPTMVYAISHSRPLHANWAHDVMWSVLFNDTANIKQGPAVQEDYANGMPSNWNNSSLAWHEKIEPQDKYTAYQHYGEEEQMLFEMPLAQSIVKSLSENLSSLVLSFLEPMREQYAKSDLHLCVHVREGNNETGDWQRKEWRHIDVISILNMTLVSMRKFTKQSNAEKVSVFVASDTKKVRSWFEENAPADWHVVKPAKELPRPENGVWFGEFGSPTNSNLSQNELNEAMAEAVADMFALGECDALFIPSYSSFSIVGIILARAERRKVFFHWFREYIEYPS